MPKRKRLVFFRLYSKYKIPAHEQLHIVDEAGILKKMNTFEIKSAIKL